MSSTDDTLHRNAKIYTLDVNHPWATAFTVADGIITAVGGDGLIKAAAAAETIDHGGAFLMPGLGDVHTHHLLEGGRSADFVVLDRNSLVTPPDELAGTTPISTSLAGRQVFAAA